MKKIYSAVLFIISISSFAQNGFNVDVLPANIGGKEEFIRIFKQELIYPKNSLKKKLGGKVVFHFTIMKDSSAVNIKINKSGIDDIDKEALRLFKLFQWVPAFKDGTYVNADWSISFNFNPKKYYKICAERGYVNFNFWKEFQIDSTGINQNFNKWEIDSTQKVYYSPEQIPEYPKGNYALQDFIKANLEYPRQAQISNIQGTVMVRFVVEPNGLVTNIGIMKSTGGGCDQEAVRIMEMMAKWKPGRTDGKLVRVQMAIPFNFILSNEFRDNSAGEQH